MVFQHTQLVIKAAIPPFNTLGAQLDRKHIKQFFAAGAGARAAVIRKYDYLHH